MCAKSINLRIVSIETHVDTDILKKFVVIRNVVFLIVKRDTLEFAIFKENLNENDVTENSDKIKEIEQKLTICILQFINRGRKLT